MMLAATDTHALPIRAGGVPGEPCQVDRYELHERPAALDDSAADVVAAGGGRSVGWLISAPAASSQRP